MLIISVLLLTLSAEHVVIPSHDIQYYNKMDFDNLDYFYSEHADCIYITEDDIIIAAFPAHMVPSREQRDTLGTIWFPDELGGIAYPHEFCANPTNGSVYIIGYYGQNIAVCNAQTGNRTDGILTGRGTMALAYSAAQDKLYCPQYYAFSVDVVDCSTNDVIETIACGGPLTDACWNSIDDSYIDITLVIQKFIL